MIMERKNFESCLSGWDVKNLLAKGSVGQVYEAYKDTCDYAIKVTRLNNSTDEIEFNREKLITREMSDVNVAAKLFESMICIAPNGDKFGIMVFEKYDMTLSEYVLMMTEKYNLSLTIEEHTAIENLIKTMHSKGIAHLDLKPGNVMVKIRGGKPQFALIDFGFSGHIDDKPLGSFSLDPNRIIAYYRKIYYSCFTSADATNIRDHIGDVNWDARFIDERFLCVIRYWIRK